MGKLTVQGIRNAARAIIAATAGGIRYSALVEAISRQSPETPRNTIHGAVWNLDSTFPNEIAKPSRGLFTAVQSGSEAVVVGKTEEIATTGIKIKEADFYEPFAELLKNDLGDVIEVIELGGAGLKSKWATPDVVGVYKPLAKDHIKFDIEIVSAEVKIDPQAAGRRLRPSSCLQAFLDKDLHRDAQDNDRGRQGPPRVIVHALRRRSSLVRAQQGESKFRDPNASSTVLPGHVLCQ
jgi:hypothetical protein